MKRYAPLLTILVVAVLGAALFAINLASDPARTAAPPVAAPADQSGAATADAPTVPAPAEAEPPAVPQTVWAGRSSGNEVTVAIAVKDGRAIAYVCDGDQIEAWLEGNLEGDQLALEGSEGASITGTVDETAAFGTVAVDGRDWPYSAKAVEAPEGLYDGRANVDGVATRIGWIALDGTVTGGARNQDGVVVQAPPFDPTTPEATTLDGGPVAVTLVEGDFTGAGR